MNPRILKKLCKRVDAIVGELNPGLERVDYNDGDIPNVIRVDRKHFEHWSGKPNRYGYFAPKKNTIGYGSVSGYYEAEWEDETAWKIFADYIRDMYTDWDQPLEEGWPKCTVKIKNPADVFRYAAKAGVSV